jgi:hypothetical protein
LVDLLSSSLIIFPFVSGWQKNKAEGASRGKIAILTPKKQEAPAGRKLKKSLISASISENQRSQNVEKSRFVPQLKQLSVVSCQSEP